MMKWGWAVSALTAGLLAAVSTAGAQAPVNDARANEAVAKFYDGKQISILLGGIGGEFDLNVRLMSRFFPSHMPGSPRIVPQYMTGAGGLKRAGYLNTVAPKDGTVLGLIPENFPALQAIGAKGIDFDVTKFYWIGSFSPTNATFMVWHTMGVNSVADLKTKEVIAGATGRDSITYVYPTLINAFFGGKIKVIVGYEGGSTINTAMERGEVQSRMNFWSSLRLTKADWLAEKKVVIVAQSGPKGAGPEGVPILEDMAANEDDRKVIELAVSGTYLGRPLATTPNTPIERIIALRRAFDATLVDKEFLVEAEKLNVEVNPVHGEELQALIARLLTFPERLVPKARDILQ